MASGKVFKLFRISDKRLNVNLLNAMVRNVHDEIAESANKVTHTGQLYDKDDYRNTRFLDRKKEVNDNWAIKLIAEVPPSAVKEKIVACDGGGGDLGHPKVYINLDKPGNHTCGYCGLRFYKEKH